MMKLGALLGLLASGWVGAQEAFPINAADTAWLLVSTSFVFFMVIGLAFFYGGLVRRKNVLNTMMMSFIALGIVGVTWAMFGYTLAYGDGGNQFIGGWELSFLRGVDQTITEGGLPVILDFAFQGTFAIITAALISGAVVERMRFSAYMVFITIWSVVIYAPMAHWVWAPNGWFKNIMGGEALDFAGGTVVHINAAIAALVLALMIGKRKDFGSKAMLPHQVPYTLLGAGILWFGWFGFNGGSAYGANALAAMALTNTMLAPAATIVVWAILDMVRPGKITAVGLATAVVVGLVAVTPAAGFITPMSAIIIGVIATFPCYFFLNMRANSSLDDSLDVFGAHGLGGITGALLTGFFATSFGDPEGVNGGVGQFLIQLVAVLIAMAYSGVGTFIIAKVISLFIPLRADERTEEQGLDIPVHGEEAYTDGEGALLIPVATSKRAAQVVGTKVKS